MKGAHRLPYGMPLAFMIACTGVKSNEPIWKNRFAIACKSCIMKNNDARGSGSPKRLGSRAVRRSRRLPISNGRSARRTKAASACRRLSYDERGAEVRHCAAENLRHIREKGRSFIMIKLSPSILSADFANLERDIKIAVDAGAEYVQV